MGRFPVVPGCLDPAADCGIFVIRDEDVSDVGLKFYGLWLDEGPGCPIGVFRLGDVGELDVVAVKAVLGGEAKAHEAEDALDDRHLGVEVLGGVGVDRILVDEGRNGLVEGVERKLSERLDTRHFKPELRGVKTALRTLFWHHAQSLSC